MYEAFFGLREKPFNLTPDPRFLFLSEKHKEAFAHLLYGIKNRSGFVMVTGEIGTGKTTISRTLLHQLHDDTEIAFIFNPFLSPEELLQKINEDFGIESKGTTIKDLVDELNVYLLDRSAHGKNCILVIDEAQDLAPNVLEHVRLLSNLETETQKLLQIILIGQPELAQHLQLPELRQLNQRITARYHLQPLDRAETIQYIAFRLRAAGGRRKIRFSRGSLKAVYRWSGGVPRVINSICDRALLIAYTQETCDINAAIIARAAREVRGGRIVAPKRRAQRRWFPWAPTPVFVVLALVLALCCSLAYEQWFSRRQVIAPTDGPSAAGGQTPAIPHSGLAANAVLAREGLAAVASPTEASTPQPKRSLADALATLDPVTARNGAAVGLLQAWNMALLGGYPAGDDIAQLAAFASSNGLTLTSMPVTAEQLAAIGLPAFVKIAGDKDVLWLGLVGIGDKQVRLTTAIGETTDVPWDAFVARYQRQAAIVWRDPAPTTGVLRIGMAGPAVQDLQQRLAAADVLKGAPTGTFDAATVAAVQRMQQLTGLGTDGKVGANTRMVLESWAGRCALPAFAQGKMWARTLNQPEAPVASPIATSSETVATALEPAASSANDNAETTAATPAESTIATAPMPPVTIETPAAVSSGPDGSAELPVASASTQTQGTAE